MIASYMKARRNELGLTQEDLGAAIEREQKYVSRLESVSARFPEPEMLRRLAVALQCRPADLLISAGYLDADDDERFGALHVTAARWAAGSPSWWACAHAPRAAPKAAPAS